MVEQSNREISKKIGDEERPIILRHRSSSEIYIVDDIDPHVTCIVSKVLAKFLSWVVLQILPMSYIKSRCNGHLAFDTDFIEIRSACIILKSRFFARAFSLKAFKDVGAQAGGIAGAIGSISIRGQSVQRSNNEGQWCLRVVNC